MSQEEEKLIEEFKQRAGIYIVAAGEFFEDESEYTLDKLPPDCMDFISARLIEAYRSGKLAGFDECLKLGSTIDVIVGHDDFLYVKIPGDYLKAKDGFALIPLSLIEEEKKKL